MELHQKTDPFHELFVSSVTYSESDAAKQSWMHERDRAARWFQVHIPDVVPDNPQLQVYDRFRQLCNPGFSGNRWASSQYPSFTSFIGNTCMGKSTLLRAMLLIGPVGPNGTRTRAAEAGDSNFRELGHLQASLESGIPGPVTRTAVSGHLWDPTSLGVHLYKDIAMLGDDMKSDDNHPILFADCEGFQAGLATSNSERVASNALHPELSQRFRDYSDSPNMILNSPIEAECYNQNGKEGAELFYARFLYAVSDVIVFVVKEDSSIEPELRKLLEWAASAAYNSINTIAQKSLIIVRNMPLAHDPSLYNGLQLEAGIMDKLKPLWVRSTTLTAFVDKFNRECKWQSQKIINNDDLFRVFFKKTSACYIPDKLRAPASELFGQYLELRRQVDAASRDCQVVRMKSSMQYNIPTLSYIINRAFEHFRTSERPFDFYVAARNDNPNPTGMTDHIVNFLRHVEMIQEKPSGLITEMIPLAFLAWAFRQFGQGYAGPDVMFNRDLGKWCWDAFRVYDERHKKCSFRFSDGTRCAQQRISHNADNHVNSNGNREPGGFEDSGGNINRSIALIRERFIDLYGQFQQACRERQDLTSRDYQRQIRQEKLGVFDGAWNHIKSHKTCFTCLQAVPDHVLPCGHAYCTPCIQDFGQKSVVYEAAWTVDRCVLCADNFQGKVQLVRSKPRCAGIRILSLDGGGIRGIVSLALLEAVEKKIGLRIEFRDFFDLIVGTSTGGIIGLGIALNPLKSDEPNRISNMKSKFKQLAKTTFESRREGAVVGKLDYFNLTSKFCMMTRIWGSIYSPKPLQRCLRELFGDDVNLFASATSTMEQRHVRVAVTSSKNKCADRCLIANYNRPSCAMGDTSDYEYDDDFEREDENDKDMKVWEAGMATSAAPFYLTPFDKPETKKDYVDGALHANCPASYALEEASRIWPQAGEQAAPLDYLVSVGTGVQNREVHIPIILKVGGFEEVCTRFQNVLNSEKLWREFERGTGSISRHRDKIHRLNANVDGPYVAIDEMRKMAGLDDMVGRQTTSQSSSGGPTPLEIEISTLADKFIANLFFFEPEGMDGNGTPGQPAASTRLRQMAGSIRCRLAQNTLPLKQLANRSWIEFWRAEYNPNRSERLNWHEIPFLDGERNKIRTQGARFRIPHLIESLGSDESQQVIAVGFRGETPDVSMAISGFPVTLRELQSRAYTG